MSGSFRFILDGASAPQPLAAIGIAPSHVLSLTSGINLGLHLLPVTQADAAHLEARDHAQDNGTALDAVSFYVDQLDSTAFAALTPHGYVAAVDGRHIARLACICDRLTPVLGNLRKRQSPPLDRDVGLVRLLRRLANPDWAEAEAIAAGFPSPLSPGGAPYGGYMAFSDLVRLIWMHEWAHILLGHVEMLDAIGALGRLDEHSSARAAATGTIDGIPLPHVLQSFEVLADQFAIRFATWQILRGYDPAGAMAGPEVDLVPRLCALAAACAVFAVDAELKQGPRDPDTATHPSAALRYMTMLQEIESICIEYDPTLVFARIGTFGMIEDLAKLAEDFSPLLAITPMIAKTPIYNQLTEVADYLFAIGAHLDPLRRPYIYLPRR